MIYEYYGSFLDKNEGQTYCGILKCLTKREESVSFSRMDVKCLGDIYSFVRLDHPEIFWVDGFSYIVGGDYIKFIPKYCFNEKKAENIAKSLETRCERIIRPVENATDGEKVRFVHDWIVKNVTYTSLYKNYSHEIFGVLSHGIGVCEGISKTAKYMLDRLDVDSIVVFSEVNEQNVAHAWNIIYLFGKPKHFDITFDLSSNSSLYYGVVDERIFRDHKKSKYPIPVCK